MIKLTLMKGKEVEIKDRQWKCKEDKQFQEMLNSRYTIDRVTSYSPDYDHDLALLAIKEWGGKITKVTGKPKFVKGRVY